MLVLTPTEVIFLVPMYWLLCEIEWLGFMNSIPNTGFEGVGAHAFTSNVSTSYMNSFLYV